LRIKFASSFFCKHSVSEASRVIVSHFPERFLRSAAFKKMVKALKSFVQIPEGD